MTRRTFSTVLDRMEPNSGERWDNAMEPRRRVDGWGKHRCAMVVSTHVGREVGPGEKLWTFDAYAGGVNEPRRAGWEGSILLWAVIAVVRAIRGTMTDYVVDCFICCLRNNEQ